MTVCRCGRRVSRRLHGVTYCPVCGSVVWVVINRQR